MSGTIVKITLAAGLGLSSLTMDVARTSAIPIIDPGVATEAAAHTGRDYKASTPGLRSSLSMLVRPYWPIGTGIISGHRQPQVPICMAPALPETE